MSLVYHYYMHTSYIFGSLKTLVTGKCLRNNSNASTQVVDSKHSTILNFVLVKAEYRLDCRIVEYSNTYTQVLGSKYGIILNFGLVKAQYRLDCRVVE